LLVLLWIFFERNTCRVHKGAKKFFDRMKNGSVIAAAAATAATAAAAATVLNLACSSTGSSSPFHEAVQFFADT